MMCFAIIKGCINLVATKLINYATVQEAEMLALDWAIGLTEMNGWENILWSSDAKFVVLDINSLEEPLRWETRYGILAIRERKLKFNWTFQWHSRSSNSLTDKAFNLSFVCNFVFNFIKPALLPCWISPLSFARLTLMM